MNFRDLYPDAYMPDKQNRLIYGIEHLRYWSETAQQCTLELMGEQKAIVGRNYDREFQDPRQMQRMVEVMRKHTGSRLMRLE